jgi:hypothetical protein
VGCDVVMGDTIIRVQKQDNYTIINNECIKDIRLSWKAKGLMAYLLSLPNDWKINIIELEKHATDGIKALRSGLKELKDLGYIKRFPVRDNETKKIISWEFNVYETPQKPLTQNLQVGKVEVGNLHVGNGTLLNTNKTNNLNKLSTNKKEEEINDLLNQVKNESLKVTLQDFLKHRKAIKAPMTTQAFKMLLTQLGKLSESEEGKIAILNQSILNGWKGVFEIKDNTQQRQVKQSEGNKPSNWITTDLSTIDFKKYREVPWMSDDD